MPPKVDQDYQDYQDYQEYLKTQGKDFKQSTPSGEPGDEKPSDLVNFGKGVLTGDIPAAASNIGGMVSGIGSGIANTPSAVADVMSNPAHGSAINHIMDALGKHLLGNMSGDQIKSLALKMGMGGGGAAAGGALGEALAPESGGASLAIPALMSAIGGTAGTQGAQEVSEAAGYEPDTPAFSLDKAHQAVQSFLTQLGASAAFNTTGAVLEGTGGALKKATLSKATLEDMKRMDPDALAGVLTVGARVGDSQLATDMRPGAKTFSKVYLDEMQGAKNAVDARDKLLSSIGKRSDEKQSIIDSVDSAYKSASPADKNKYLFSEGDLGLGPLGKEIAAKADQEGIGSDRAAVQQSILNEMHNEFTKDMPHHAGGTYQVPIKKTFGEMQDMLNATYDELRKLRLFDDSVGNKLAKGDEGALEQVQDRIDIYKTFADKIRTAMDQKLSKLGSSNLVPSGTSGRFAALNSQIHDLMPYVTGFERFIDSARQAVVQDPPRSLVQKSGSIFGRAPSTIGQALDIAAKPVVQGMIDKSALQSQIGFTPDTLNEIGQIAQLQTGARQPVQGVQSVPAGIGYGAGAAAQGVGAIADGLGSGPGAAAMTGAQQSTWDPDNFDAVAHSPAFMTQLQNDPDIPDDTKQMLIQSQNGTQFEKNKALGQLKIDARNKGWFPPPPMQGIHSFIKLPDAKYRGEKVLGTITDPAEGALFQDAINEIPDVEKRARLKAAFNSTGHYVLEIPSTLKPKPRAEPVASRPEPKAPDDMADSGGGTAPTLSAGQSSMERVVHDY